MLIDNPSDREFRVQILAVNSWSDQTKFSQTNLLHIHIINGQSLKERIAIAIASYVQVIFGLVISTV